MENQEFKIGDTIITTEDGVSYKKGEIGTVKELKDSTLCYMVQFKHKSEPVSEKRLQLYKEEPEFIVGKWYKSNVNSLSWFYIKFIKKSEDEIWGECIRLNPKAYNEYDYWNDTKAIEQALELGYLTDLSEIQPYLPDNHPDKTVKQENLVGRYFKALEDDIDYSHVIKGNYYQVVRLNERKNITFYTEYSIDVPFAIDKSNYHLLEFMPEGWTPESDKIEVFPDVFVGDYVIYLSHDHDSYKKGSIAKVHENSSKGKLVIYWKGKQVGTYWSSFKYHRKATKEQIEWHLLNPNVYDNINDMPKELPKPEYVECIKGLVCADYSIKGRIYKVDHYNPKKGIITIQGHCIYNIFFGEKSESSGNSTDYKISTKEAYEAQNKPKETSTEWIPKVGDVVECIKEEGFKSDSKNYLIESGIKLGQKYQVIGYVKEYNYVDGKGIQLNGYNCTHPLTSFKPYQEIPTTTYTGVDYSLPKVTISNTAIDIIAPKTSNSVTLGQIQKEIKINVNFKKPVKI